MIYLDHAATTPIDKEVLQSMVALVENKEAFGNPSSMHRFGRKAKQTIDEGRRMIATSIYADQKEIIFTSGGTEADNLALIGTAMANKDKGNHIITTVQEHHAVLRAAEQLEKQGFELTYLPVNKQGKINIEDLAKALTDKTILVSIMTVNNETGVIQPIKAIGELLKNHQAYFHTDAVQAFGLLELNVKECGIDLLTVSSHKINGPKGVGFLYAARNVSLAPVQFGGEQERKKRAGTENTVGIIGLKKAVELAVDQREKRFATYARFKQHFIQILRSNEIDYQLNGAVDETVPSIVNISFPGTNVEALLMNFDLEGIAASSGSACTAGSIEPSHVLAAMYGKEDDRVTNSVRFSFGNHNSMENIKEAAEIIVDVVKRLTKKRVNESDG